jgi:Protein of unknown function (DUF1194)
MRIVDILRAEIWGFERHPATPFRGNTGGLILAAHGKGKPMRSIISGVMLAALLALPGGASAQNTDLLLVLAADVSRSIDESEFALQRKGYSAALTDPRVLAAIRGGANGSIAICFVEWSGAGEQTVVADWTLIRDEEDAGGLAAIILAAPRSFIGRTSISGAIDFAMERFEAAQPRAGRHIIDISGDGTNNSGRPVTEARDQALAQGVTINGLAIVNDKPNPGYAFHTQPPGGLPEWYRQNVIGGPGAFLRVIEDFHSFADAMTNKLVSEIAALSPQRRPAALR